MMMEENLRETLLGGQTFSWREEDDSSFSAVLNEKVYHLRSLEDAASDSFLRSYFDRDYDYAKAAEDIAGKDEVLSQAVRSTGVIRL